ncbi:MULTISPECIES: TerD family protein [Bacillus]|uniref:TerD family protein n=1 Tax=Bacillus TaxID=1386 RepID=UPI001E42F05D|nr:MULTISPECIES: TerD family protein [Bacillus]
MTLQLCKGQKVDLTKTNPTLNHIKVGLGWDLSTNSNSHAFDLDAAAFLLDVNDETFKVQRLVKYFRGHLEMDRHYKWNMNWVAGSK